MAETTFEVSVATPLLQFGFGPEEVQKCVNEWLAISLFTENHASSGKAAHLLGITRAEFLDLLKKRGIAYINYPPNELDEEFTAVNELRLKTTE